MPGQRTSIAGAYDQVAWREATLAAPAGSDYLQAQYAAFLAQRHSYGERGIAMSTLGPRGIALLSVTGIAGVILAVLGWSQRGTGLIAGQSGAPLPSAAPGASGPPGAGPALRSEPYASYTYQVWPGPLSANGRQAIAGFTLAVASRGGGIALRADQNGQAMRSASHFYPGGAKVYAIDSTLGDEGGNTDYDTADDGLVVTNSRGQVLP
jgi:hypothetical protein